VDGCIHNNDSGVLVLKLQVFFCWLYSTASEVTVYEEKSSTYVLHILIMRFQTDLFCGLDDYFCLLQLHCVYAMRLSKGLSKRLHLLRSIIALQIDLRSDERVQPPGAGAARGFRLGTLRWLRCRFQMHYWDVVRAACEVIHVQPFFWFLVDAFISRNLGWQKNPQKVRFKWHE
jgi:hypothetical protein